MRKIEIGVIILTVIASLILIALLIKVAVLENQL